MLTLTIAILITAVAFGLFGYAGVLIARTFYADVTPLPDAPPSVAPPVRTIVAFNVLVGAYCAYRGVPAQTLAIIASVSAVLSAIWCTDSTRGIVPDALTLFPLGVVLLSGLLANHTFVILAAILPALPFALLAWRTKGIGMGWGDVKLAALGGALVGMQDAMLVFAIAAVVAVVVTRLRGTPGKPLAFAPYLAVAIIVPLVLQAP